MENSKTELKHYGVKGMRWGYRKATATDKRRIGDMGTAKTVSDTARGGFEAASRAAGGIGNLARKPSKKVQKELENMSDQELRTRINRMNMEREYAALNPNKVQVGASYAKTALEVAGSVAVVAGTALSIAIAIKKARLTDVKK